MRIGALKETVAGEQRVAMTPDSASNSRNSGMNASSSQVLVKTPVFLI